MHVGTISAVIDILLCNGNIITFAIEEYLTKMGPNCTITCDRGITSMTLYCNIYAAGHWINRNVMGVTYIFSIYTPTLYLVDCTVRHDSNFCMCIQLLDTTIDAKMRLRTSLHLPCLITQLYRTFISDIELDAYVPSRVYIVMKHIFVIYHTTVPKD